MKAFTSLSKIARANSETGSAPSTAWAAKVPSATTTFGAVRVFYKLRVSPGPGAATFSDVPVSNPFFPFVEALVASGVTGGCGGGNYCPDAPVTRGQMAVFLAVALGLHFPF